MKIFRLFVAFTLICFALAPQARADCNQGCGELGGKFNTFLGEFVLRSNTTGAKNTAIGFAALERNTSGNENTVIGTFSMDSNKTGNFNTAVGAYALSGNQDGSDNTAIGRFALFNNSGSHNTATGTQALRRNETGQFNTANGEEALVANRSGERNTAIGFRSLKNSSGSFNVALGAGAGEGVTTADDVICIGRGVDGVNVGGTCFIGNIWGVTTQNANALPVVIDGAGQLGTVASSQRFKKDIAIMDKASEGILSLRPVTFHYKTDSENTPQFGLIAEEVAKVNPNLIVRDKEGKPYSVRYDQVNAMLLNEFLKEHKTVQEQGATIKALNANDAKKEARIALQQKQIDALTAGLQKVSAQLELSKASPQTVLNQ